MVVTNVNSVGILGGTGPAGRAFAARLASIGLQVRIGSRSVERAEEACSKVHTKWPEAELKLQPCTNTEAAGADLVVVATPWDAAASTAEDCEPQLRDKVVISMANAIAKLEGELQAVMTARGSVAAGVQAVLPDSFVVAAMHHVPARELGDISAPVECDVLVCSDHPDATEVTMSLLARIPGIRPVNAGGLSSAVAIEAFTAVLLGVNIRYRTRAAIQLTNLPSL